MTDKKNLSDIEQAKTIVKQADKAFEQVGYIKNRCLAGTIVTEHLLQEQGWKVEHFPCRADGYNKKMIEMIEEHRRLPTSNEEALEWKKLGAKVVSIIPNHTGGKDVVASPMNGHYCLVAKKGQKYIFVDAALGQFKRTLIENGWVLDVPATLVMEIPAEIYNQALRLNKLKIHKALDASSDDKPELSTHLPCGGYLTYRYERIKSVDKLKSRPNSSEYKKTDLYLKKHNEVLKLIRKV